jgi:EAL domain-containing protein (putative c-di-GMP-specific phosphodiesterase class I)
VLSKAGLDVQSFTSSAPLFAAIVAHRPEFLVLDLALGLTDGIEVIRHLETLKYQGKVLLISGRGELPLAEARKIGVSRGLAMLPSLAKPFRAADLVENLAASAELVEKICQKPRVQTPAQFSLREALDERWLNLWYQPKFDVKAQTPCGAEALLRLHHPQHGIISPAAFLPPPSDPIHKRLADFVIKRAAADWNFFADLGLPLKLSINLPLSIVSGPAFVGFMRENLPGTPDFPGLIVEITEDEALSNLMDVDLLNEIAIQLRLYGVTLSIDDFGTAYSTLARFLHLSFSEVKLDRSFVTGCAADPMKRALCQTVINLAHRFDASACAEGVETGGDLAALTAMGCDLAQGYLIGKPMPRDQFASSRLNQAGSLAV